MESPDACMTRPISTSQGVAAFLAMEAPTPSRIPATGRTETGNIRALPIFCRPPKVLPQWVARFMVLVSLGSDQ